MRINEPINRCLKDTSMDHIDHALGRPLDPWGGSRNYFAAGGEIAREMHESPYWLARVSHSHLTFFVVTYAGRLALEKYLREIGDPHRLYIVEYDDHEMEVVATSRANAQNRCFLTISDTALQGITFAEFRRHSSTRLVKPTRDDVVPVERGRDLQVTSNPDPARQAAE